MPSQISCCTSCFICDIIDWPQSTTHPHTISRNCTLQAWCNSMQIKALHPQSALSEDLPVDKSMNPKSNSEKLREWFC